MSAQPIEKSPTEGLGAHESRGPQDGPEGPTPERGATRPSRSRCATRPRSRCCSAWPPRPIAIAYLWRAASTGAAFDWLLCADARGAQRGPVPQPARRAAAAAGRRRARCPLPARSPVARPAVGGGRPHRRRPRGAGCCVTAAWSSTSTTCTAPSRASRGAPAATRALNQKMYGAVLAVPLGLTTRITHATEENLQERFAALAHGRAEVVTLLPEPEPVPAARRPDHDAVATAPATDPVEAGSRSTRTATSIGDDEQPPPADRRPRWLRRGPCRRSPPRPRRRGVRGRPTVDERPATTYDLPDVAEPPEPGSPGHASTKACARWGPRPPRCRPSPRR